MKHIVHYFEADTINAWKQKQGHVAKVSKVKGGPSIPRNFTSEYKLKYF